MRTRALRREIEAVEGVEVGGARGATIQVLLGPEDEMPRFFTRRFTLAPGGRIPRHLHPDIEHQQVVLSGSMSLELGDETIVASAGEAVYIPAGLAHAYENSGQADCVFLCMVPKTDEYTTEWLETLEK